MDLLTHTVLTALLVGRRRTVLLSGIGPDLTWYAIYPRWAIANEQGRPRPSRSG